MDVEGEDGIHLFHPGVSEGVLKAGDRQARIVGVPRLKRAPAGDPDDEGQRGIAQLDPGEREVGPEGRLVEAGQPETHRPRAGCGMPALVEFPAGDRALDDAGDLPRAAEGDGGEEPRLVLDQGPVADRHVGQTARTLQAHHPRPESPEREGDLVQLLAGENRVGRPGRVRSLGDGRRSRRAGERGGGEGAEGANRGANEIAAADEPLGHAGLGPRRRGKAPTKGVRFAHQSHGVGPSLLNRKLRHKRQFRGTVTGPLGST